MEHKEMDKFLLDQVTEIISKLTEEDMLVCVSDTSIIAKAIATELQVRTPHLTISSEELSGVGSLVYHAVNDKNFFDWEMPTLTGYTSDQFKEIAAKLPKI